MYKLSRSWSVTHISFEYRLVHIKDPLLHITRIQLVV